jgi:alpha-beta hydrolase superfamily lysophospholipase
MAAKGGGFGNAVRDLVRSVTGSGEVRRAEDKAASAPSYSAFSVKGLTSSDPANVARNQAAAKMYADMPASVSRDRPEAPAAAAAAAAPAAPAVTPMPVLPAPTLTPPAAPAPVGSEAPTSAVEAAAIESTKGGRASTILTSTLGLLADAEATGQLRKRRSLMGGGLIQ